MMTANRHVGFVYKLSVSLGLNNNCRYFSKSRKMKEFDERNSLKHIFNQYRIDSIITLFTNMFLRSDTIGYEL